MIWTADELKLVNDQAFRVLVNLTTQYKAVMALETKMKDRSKESIRSCLKRQMKRWDYECQIRTGLPRFGE